MRDFIKAHPNILTGVDWHKSNPDRAAVLHGSISKRIVRDLLCKEKRAQLVSAMKEYELSQTAKKSEGMRSLSDVASSLGSKLVRMLTPSSPEEMDGRKR